MVYGRYLIVFAIIGLLSANAVVSQTENYRICKSDGQVIPDMSWLNQIDGIRPKYVWENREDFIYHDRYYSDSSKLTAPEIYPIMRCAWVFNRAMKWKRNPDRTIIAWSEGGDLILTGEKQVSAWYSDPLNKITSSGDKTIFEKLNNRRQRDCAVIPAFQFHLGQHPVIEITVLESTDDWQFVASLKGRSGPPLISSGWQTGSKTLRFDIAGAMKKKGYDLNYAEIHFVVGTWTESAQSTSRIEYKARLISRPAVVGCLPVIRNVEKSPEGIPVSALLSGNVDDKNIKVYSVLNCRKYEMTKKGDVWSTEIKGLPVGSYNLELISDDSNVAGSGVLIVVTDGNFWKHNSFYNTLNKNNITYSPLTGSFQGTFFFKDAGLASEQMINSQPEWDLWNRLDEPGEHMHYWESLTRAELNHRFAYLADNGWDVVFLHSHFGIWERFDASGNLAPHGIEQFAVYVDEARKNNLKVMVALSSYPYEDSDNSDWKSGTKPYLQTLEKGFKNGDWQNPENEPFRSIYHQYLKDFITIFRDETSILAFSGSGEGDADFIGGLKRFRDTREVIRSIDKDHLIVSEPVHVFDAIEKLPSSIAKGYDSDLTGVRNYLLGTRSNTDEEMSIYLRLSRSIPNLYLAEGSWPGSNVYTKFSASSESDSERNSWVGTNIYRYNVRDWVYLGFVFRLPLIMTWDESFTEDERIVISEAKTLINWNQEWEQAPVAILVDNENFAGVRNELGNFEKLFSQLSVDYRFIDDPKKLKPGDWLIHPEQASGFAKYMDSRKMPARIQKTRPFSLSKDYSTSFSISKDRKTLIAYILNRTRYLHQQFNLTGKYHRVPVPADFELVMLNLPANLNYKLYDLDSKKIKEEGRTEKNRKISIRNTKADYLLIVHP